MNLTTSNFLQYLTTKFNDKDIQDKSLCLTVRPDNLYTIFQFLKNSWISKYKILIDITAVHYPSLIKRGDSMYEFVVVYCLLSTDYNQRIIIECLLKDSLEYVPSIQIYIQMRHGMSVKRMICLVYYFMVTKIYEEF